jgi:VanZ family protein
MTRLLHPAQWRVLAILWTLGIVAACSLPGRSLPQSGLFEFDKLIHAALFFGFGVLWLLALQAPLPLRRWRVLFVGLAFAVLTEVYQGVLPFERFPDPYDALANGLGLCAALLAHSWWTQRQPSSP